MLTVYQLWGSGVLHPNHLVYDVLGMPAAGIGIALGVAVYNRLNPLVFTRIVVAAMLVTGVAYIAHAIIELHHGAPVESLIAGLNKSNLGLVKPGGLEDH